MGAFKATWPNLLVEPDSEKSKTAKVQMDAVVEAFNAMVALGDPDTTANTAEWLAANVNERTELFAGKLVIVAEALKASLESKAEQAEEAMNEAGSDKDKGRKREPGAEAA